MKPSRTIGRAAAVVGVGILLSRILGFARSMVINWMFGLGADNDLYQAAFTIPDWIFFMMAGGYLSITLVPLLTGHLADGDDSEAQATFSSVFVMVTGLMTAVTVAAMVAARPITRLFFDRAHSLSTGLDLDRLTTMTRIALVSQVFFVAGTLLMAGQYAHRRFLIPTLAPLIYNGGIILGGLVGWWAGDPSPEAFLWGGLVGAATGNFGLQWWGSNRAGLDPLSGADLRHPDIRRYFALALPLMIGQSVVALDEQWPRWFGQLVGEGAIGGITAARQLNMVPVGVIAQAAGVAAFPFLAGLFAQGRSEELETAVTRSVRGAVMLAAPAGAITLVMAEPLVRLAYQRGAFDAQATHFVSGVLAVYALSIPFWAAHQVYSRAFYSRRQMWTPVVIGTLLTAVTLPLLWWAAVNGGGVGIAAVSVASLVAYTVIIGRRWHQGASGGREVVNTAGRALVAAGMAGLTGRWVLDALRLPDDVIGLFAQLATGSVIIALIYLTLARLLGLKVIKPDR